MFAIISSFLLIALLLYPFMLGSFLSVKKRKIINNDIATLAYTTIIPVNKNLPSLYFYPIFLIKRLIFGIYLIALFNYYYIQLAGTLILSIAVYESLVHCIPREI